MAKKMNKKAFLEKLASELSYSIEKCMIINDVLESNFFISKQSRDKIIEELIQKLEIEKEEATKIYEVATTIVKDEIKNKLKHPFRSVD